MYLDNNAWALCDPRTVEYFMRLQSMGLANPSSNHTYGRRASRIVERARGSILRGITASTGYELVFVASPTEALNLAVQGASWSRIAVLSTEHPAVIRLCAWEAKRRGAPLHRLRVDGNGVVDLGDAKAFMSGGSSLVVVQMANGDTGVLQNIGAVVAFARQNEGSVLCDATQAAAWENLDLGTHAADLVVLGGHKLFSPTGLAALVVRSDVRPSLRPVMVGGGQERGLRPGTLSASEAATLAFSLALVERERDEYCASVRSARDLFEETLAERLGDVLVVHGKAVDRLPNTSGFSVRNLGFEGVQAVAAIGLGTGAACTSGAVRASHVLTAMGVRGDDATNFLRVSFGRTARLKEGIEAANVVAEAVGVARGRTAE